MSVKVRVVSKDDAGPLAELISAERDFMAPWQPARPEDYFTEEIQRRDISQALFLHDYGTALPYVILDDDTLVGRITVSDIVQGPFQSGHLGYWVSQAHNGRGVATAAVAEVIRFAFEGVGLHRLQAGTLVHNLRSQRVLLHNGFERFGLAPRYLNIAGQWQDHVLFQLLNE